MRVRCQDERMKNRADATAERSAALADELKWFSKKFGHRV